MIVDCCQAGEQTADTSTNCTDFQPPSNVSAALLSSCYFASEICCSAKLRIESCKAGVIAGKEGLDCHSNSSEFYTGCCEACKIGMVNGAGENDCPLDPFMFGAPFDDSYMYCCREMKASDTFYVPDGEEGTYMYTTDAERDPWILFNVSLYLSMLSVFFQLTFASASIGCARSCASTRTARTCASASPAFICWRTRYPVSRTATKSTTV